MKKLLIPLSLMTVTAIATGCSMSPKTSISDNNVAKSLSNNLTELVETTKKVKDIDENKLIINELSPNSNINKDYQTNNNTSSYKYNGKWVNNGNGSYINNGSYNKQSSINNSYNNANSKSTANSKSNINNTQVNANTQTNNYVTDGGTLTDRYATPQYNPRYTKVMTSGNASLAGYMEKIQDLYSICNDTCAVSTDLEGLKNELINSCNNCNNLLARVKNGEIKLSTSQIKTLNEYNRTLQSCINDMKSCKDCSEDVNIINTLKGNFSNNCDTLVAKYLKVLNNLDTNSSLCNNARCTVAEINNYISSISGGQNVKTSTNRYTRYERFYDIDPEFSVDGQNTINTNQNQIPNNPKPTQSNTITTNTLNPNPSNNIVNTTNTTSTNTNKTTTTQNPTSNNTTSSNTALSNQKVNNSNINKTSSQSTNVYAGNKIVRNGTTYYPIKPANTDNATTYPFRQNTTKTNTTANPDYVPNTHPHTKDIKETNTEYINRFNNSKKVFAQESTNTNQNVKMSAPAPQGNYAKYTTSASDLKTSDSTIKSKPSYTNSTLDISQKHVRANNNTQIMTLEYIHQ